MLSASPVGLTAWCAETPIDGNSSTVHLLFTEINFEHPSQSEWGVHFGREVLGIHAELTISSTMVLSNAANIEYARNT